MTIVFMMVGIPGSGKTTFAKKLAATNNCPIVSTDGIRATHKGIEEREVWPMAYQTCAEYIEEGRDFVFDATNITPFVRKRFVDEVKKYTTVDFGVGVYFLKTDWKTCLARVVRRNLNPNELFLPPEVIEGYGQRFITPTLDEGFVFIETIDNNDEMNG